MRMQHRTKKQDFLFAGAALFLAWPTKVLAEEKPVFSADAVIEMQNEYALDSDDPDLDGRNNVFLRAEMAPNLRLNDNFFIDGVIVLEPVQDFDANEDNFFEETGIFIEEIKLNFKHGPWRAFIGKFNPAFGIAWDYGRGIWGEDFAEDYEITERLGVGASYRFETEQAGTHTLTASTFFADTSVLSDSIGTGRDRTSKHDGGSANTEDFSSFALSLEGEDVAGIENLYYKLGYRHQAQGNADSGGDDETGGVITLGYSAPVSDRTEAKVFLEYAGIGNFDTMLEDRNYLTASIGVTFDERWIGTVSYTNRQIVADGGEDYDDNLLQISAGYDFGQGTTAELGWRHTDEEDINTDIMGVLVRHQFSF